jgi:dolichol kinase
MLLPFIATGIGGVVLLLICELLIRKKVVKGENARKLVHITIALYASTWAFYLTPQLIALISIILIMAVAIVQKFKLLHSMKSVRRVTYGEMWYPLGIGISALLFTNPYIYAIAVLHMGLADGLAAVVGIGMGKEAKRFKIGGNTKSVAGTLVFIITSFVIYLAYWMLFSGSSFFESSVVYASILSLSSAIIVATIEVVAPKGSDNILVPVCAGLFALLPTMQVIV